MLNLGHKKLNAWKSSIDFVVDIYKITETLPKTEIYGITNQLCRAAVSAASNLAEGASRKSSTERKRFYEISRSSIVEIDTQLEIAIQLQYIEKNNLEKIEPSMEHLFAMMTKMIKNT